MEEHAPTSTWRHVPLCRSHTRAVQSLDRRAPIAADKGRIDAAAVHAAGVPLAPLLEHAAQLRAQTLCLFPLLDRSHSPSFPLGSLPFQLIEEGEARDSSANRGKVTPRAIR